MSKKSKNKQSSMDILFLREELLNMSGNDVWNYICKTVGVHPDKTIGVNIEFFKSGVDVGVINMTVKEFYEQEKDKYPDTLKMIIVFEEETQDFDYADEIVELYGDKKVIQGLSETLESGEIALLAEIEGE